jgi:hypothetical protein
VGDKKLGLNELGLGLEDKKLLSELDVEAHSSKKVTDERDTEGLERKKKVTDEPDADEDVVAHKK